MLLTMSSLFLFSGLTLAFAAHGSGSVGGGGCKGECEAPTLGVDDQGIMRVENGLTINSKPFDVQGYSQSLPTQVFETGKPVSIELKIFENVSPEALTHAEIHFGIHDKFIEGIIVEDHIVAIVWDDQEGVEVYGIYGDEESIHNVHIDHIIESPFVLLDFEFTFTKVFEVSTMKVEL